MKHFLIVNHDLTAMYSKSKAVCPGQILSKSLIQKPLRDNLIESYWQHQLMSCY